MPLIAGEELNMLKALSLRQQQPSILNSSSNGKLQPAMLPSVSVSRTTLRSDLCTVHRLFSRACKHNLQQGQQDNW